MPMTREEHAGKLAEILANPGDTAMISDSLTAISENYAGMLADSALLSSENERLTAANASLVEQNMKLFLKVGTVVDQPAPVVEEEEVPTFESLFDEMGNLK